MQLPGQLPINRSRAWVDPVVKTTSEPFVPISAATAARPASSTGAAASAATYPADLGFVPGVLGGGVAGGLRSRRR